MTRRDTLKHWAAEKRDGLLSQHTKTYINKHRLTDEDLDDYMEGYDDEEEPFEVFKAAPQRIVTKPKMSVTEKERKGKSVCIYLSIESSDKIKEIAYQNRTSVSAMIEEYIQSL